MQEVEGRCLIDRDTDNGISDLVKVSCIGIEFSESIQLNARQQFIYWINPNEQGKDILKFKVAQFNACILPLTTPTPLL